MLHPTVFNTSAVCHDYGVRHAVISPGSRNAPLTVSFARNDSIKKWVIPDERAAAFIALGIAQVKKEPVALVCTSGTALLNYAPAVAEAYYREIPLIVLSADRPPELIDQRDGQTIRQFGALQNHVIASHQLPVVANDDSGKEYLSKLNAALAQLSDPRCGPIHLNIPFREPFYPDVNQGLTFTHENDRHVHGKQLVVPKIELAFKDKKVLVLIGQQSRNLDLTEFLNRIKSYVPVVHSPLSNAGIKCISHADLFLKDQLELKPEILLTCGMSVLSKSVKNFIKKNKPIQHLHFDPAGIEVDTYSSNPILIKSAMHEVLQATDLSQVDSSYLAKWREYETIASDYLEQKHLDEFSEIAAAKAILDHLPQGIQLHLSNSTPVRYADLLGVKDRIEVWSNRGTSGIDGCTSTAVGSSLVDGQIQLLITGDLAFLYDRNAFFHNYDLRNLRIIVLNNGGGGIFRLIDGPSNLPELEMYFETRHERTAKYICEENYIAYQLIEDMEELMIALSSFYEPSDHPKLLEIRTKPEINQKEFSAFKKGIHEHTND